MIICTSICSNYISKALVLAKSVKTHIKGSIFVLCLVEMDMPKIVEQGIKDGIIDRVVLAKDLGLEQDFNRFIFKHTIVEASTSVKGMLFKQLYNIYPEDSKFIYLDPDIKVYSDLSELNSLMDKRPIILCPHLLHPGHIEMEISSIKYGVYNLGFLAVNRDEEAKKFINWWADRLYHYCYDDLPNGIFTDQRWVDLAPTFFDVEIFKNYGYDFGTWAVKDVTIEKNAGEYFVNKQPLRFAHFSGYDSGTIEMVQKWWVKGKNKEAYKEMVNEYTTELGLNGQKDVSKLKWSYGYYYNGQSISNNVRIAYRNENELRWKIDDPYKYSNEILCEKLEINPIKDYPKIAKKINKAVDIWVNEGLFSLIKKVIKKCFIRR